MTDPTTDFVDALVGLASASRHLDAVVAALGPEHADAALGLCSLERTIRWLLAAMVEDTPPRAPSEPAGWTREQLR